MLLICYWLVACSYQDIFIPLNLNSAKLLIVVLHRIESKSAVLAEWIPLAHYKFHNLHILSMYRNISSSSYVASLPINTPINVTNAYHFGDVIHNYKVMLLIDQTNYRTILTHKYHRDVLAWWRMLKGSAVLCRGNMSTAH